MASVAFQPSAAALLAELHGICTRAIEGYVGVHDGLTTAARSARRAGLLSPYAARKMERLDIATHFASHISSARVELVGSQIVTELQAARAPVPTDPWHAGPDPWTSGDRPGRVVDKVDVVLDALGASSGVRPRTPPPAAGALRASAVPFFPREAPPSATYAEVGVQTVAPQCRSIGIVTARSRRCSRAAGPSTPLAGGVVESGVQTSVSLAPTTLVVSPSEPSEAALSQPPPTASSVSAPGEVGLVPCPSCWRLMSVEGPQCDECLWGPPSPSSYSRWPSGRGSTWSWSSTWRKHGSR